MNEDITVCYEEHFNMGSGTFTKRDCGKPHNLFAHAVKDKLSSEYDVRVYFCGRCRRTFTNEEALEVKLLGG